MTTRISKPALMLTLFVLISACFIVFAPHPVLADVGTTISAGIDEAASGSYDTGGTLPKFIGNIIAALLAVTGMIFLVITVYAGVLYMTAAGDDQKVKKAKEMLVQSLIGLIIIIGAYALTSFVVEQIGSAASTTQEETS